MYLTVSIWNVIKNKFVFILQAAAMVDSQGKKSAAANDEEMDPTV